MYDINSDALYEEARELAEWEGEYRKLPQYKQEARVQQIMKDLIDNKKYFKRLEEIHGKTN